jgi:MATE family multidrug resistance protein
MGTIALSFVLLPGPLLDLFRPIGMSLVDFAPVAETGEVLLLVLAAFAVPDSVAIVYLGALRGAGDTRFVMVLSAATSALLLVLPAFLVLEVLELGLVWAWGSLLAYVLALATAAVLRFRAGKWTRRRVIEEAPAPAAGA